jgi:opacity protein-like surface antigen
MNRFLLAAGLLLAGSCPALAQRLVAQTATLAAGQSVFLDLKYAHSIRVRAGAGLSVQARVVINDNQQNDLYSLGLQTAGGELSVVEKLDEEKLRQTNFTGDCDGGSRNNGSHGFNVGYKRSEKTGGLRPTLNRHKGEEYSYCAKIDYEVTVPAGTALRLNTISGNLDLSGLNGTVTAKTISGNVLSTNLSGPLTLRTVSGDVKLSNLGRSPVDATSVSGSVDVSWPATQGADLNLQTISGEVYADSAVTFRNLKNRTYVGYELHGSLGSGGPSVTLHSVSGDVFFRKQK